MASVFLRFIPGRTDLQREFGEFGHVTDASPCKPCRCGTFFYGPCAANIRLRLEDIELPLTAKGVAFVEPLPQLGSPFYLDLVLAKRVCQCLSEHLEGLIALWMLPMRRGYPDVANASKTQDM